MNINGSFKQDKKEKAQSLVELAISLVIMLMLLLGAIEFSLALFQYVTIRDAAQEGALFGSFNPTDDAAIKAHVLSAANDVLILNAADVTVDKTAVCEGSISGVPNYITVKIKYIHNIAYPLVGPILGTNTITLNAKAISTILLPTCTPP